MPHEEPLEMECWVDQQTDCIKVKIRRLHHKADGTYDKEGIIIRVPEGSLYKVAEGMVYPEHALPVLDPKPDKQDYQDLEDEIVGEAEFKFVWPPYNPGETTATYPQPSYPVWYQQYSDPCASCSNDPRNGGSGNCVCMLPYLANPPFTWGTKDK